jgi:hypothetical protein
VAAWLGAGACALAAVLLAGCDGCGAKPGQPSGATTGATTGTAKGPELRPAETVATAAPPPDAVLGVPKVTEKIVTDGEAEEKAWNSSGRTGSFRDATGALARPSSEARFLWDATNLYLLLYAADEDIQAKVTEHDGAVWQDDAFSVVIAPAGESGVYTVDVSARGTVTDARRGADGKLDTTWESGAAVGVDRDGTLNESKDSDEEWVVEAAIPWAKLGITPAPGTRIGVALRRCDTPKGAARTCAGWGEEKNGRPTGTIELR